MKSNFYLMKWIQLFEKHSLKIDILLKKNYIFLQYKTNTNNM
jgi:hypothetical protein